MTDYWIRQPSKRSTAKIMYNAGFSNLTYTNCCRISTAWQMSLDALSRKLQSHCKVRLLSYYVSLSSSFMARLYRDKKTEARIVWFARKKSSAVCTISLTIKFDRGLENMVRWGGYRFPAQDWEENFFTFQLVFKLQFYVQKSVISTF